MPVVFDRIRSGSVVVLAATIALVLAVAGCGGDDDDELSHDEREVRNAGITWWRQMDAALLATTAALDVGAGGLTLAPGPLRGSLRPAHDYGISCPDVIPAVMNDLIRVYVVYGDLGCVSALTGRAHAGYVQLDVPLPGNSGVLTAANWTTGDYRVNGTIGATFQDSMVTIDARTLMVFSPDGNVTINSCLGILWSKGGTRLLLSDDSWRILGTANVNTLSLEAGAIYHLEVEDAAPVLANPRCEWPVSGRLTIERQEPALSALLDFGDGACDSKALLTVAGRTRIIDLENPPD